MRLLVLGGTAWLGAQTARQAVAAGWDVTCLARGVSGERAAGARLVVADRADPAAYDPVRAGGWDAVVELSWQPRFVREALAALAPGAGHWTYVSSGSVYATHRDPGGTESDPLLAPTADDTVGVDAYGAAKVACEQATTAAVGDRALIARAGLLGGPGDPSDRAGYWVARCAAAPDRPLLTAATGALPTAVLDVRDLAAFVLQAAAGRLTGVFDTVGPALPLTAWVALCREVGGHYGPVVTADPRWLLAHGVQEWAGPQSLPLWLADPGWAGFCARSGAAARAAGLRHRPYRDHLVDVLADERARGLDRTRSAGLSAAREAELVALLTADSTDSTKT